MSVNLKPRWAQIRDKPDLLLASDLLAALNTVAADLPQEDPQLPKKLWREPPGGVIRYTGDYGVVGSSIVGTSWVS